MYTLSPNSRLVIGSVSTLVAVGLGFWIYRNYPKYLTCGHNCKGQCPHSNKDDKTDNNTENNTDNNTDNNTGVND